MRRIIFTLEPTPPFRLDLTAWAIRRRPGNQMDIWDGETYQRVLAIQGKPALISVTQHGPIDAPRLEVTATGPTHEHSSEKASRARARAAFGSANRSIGFLRIGVEAASDVANSPAGFAV